MKKIQTQSMRILGLSHNEVRILNVLRSGFDTPSSIAQHTSISRPAIYEILARLEMRGLIVCIKDNTKKRWVQVADEEIEKEFYATKKQLLSISDGVEEIRGLSDATVTIHRGKQAVRKVLDMIVTKHKGQRLYGIQGDKVAPGWEKIYSAEGMNEWNRAVKTNMIITEMIFPHGWTQRQSDIYGKKWAKDFEGRAAMMHEIDEKYFEHGGQIFIFKKSLYLMAMNEEKIIEIHNSDIQKLILSMFRYIQDHSKKIDVNANLREIIKGKDQ